MSQPYCVVVGHTWHPALAWKVAHPGKPFVGLRLDPDDREVWVICERVVDGAQLPRSTLQAVESALETDDLDAGGFDDVFIVQARTSDRDIPWPYALLRRRSDIRTCGSSDGRLAT
jgi:hypothetical protein